jgi:hypothetical protein
LVCDDRIFIPSRDWKMWAYDLLTGEEVWHTVDLHDGRLQNYSYCSPAASGGGIYYQSLNGTFYVINQTDGDVLWSFALGDLGFGSPSIGDGNVYITNDYALYAFRIGPGSGDWPMFCQNKVHQSVSEQGVEYMRWPVAGVQYFKVSNEWVTARFLWCNATIVSASIAWRIYFVDSYGNENVTDAMVFHVRPVVHDVTVAAVAVSKTVVGCGFTLSIQATVRNVGEAEESFSVKAYANGTLVGVQTVAELHCNRSTNVTFVWNCSGFAYGNYTMSAVADTVLGENNTGDNTCFANASVHVGVPGDVTSTVEGVCDGRVDLRDVTYLILLFQTRPDSPNWKPNADVNDDGIVNIKDITIAILHFYQQE